MERHIGLDSILVYTCANLEELISEAGPRATVGIFRENKMVRIK